MDVLSFVVPRILLFAVTHGSGVFIVPCRNPQGLLQVAGDLWQWRGSCCHLAGQLQEGHHMKTAFFITALGTQLTTCYWNYSKNRTEWHVNIS
ncbi:hypothetical protein ACQJBY_030207 [Aegilops geniculata]